MEEIDLSYAVEVDQVKKEEWANLLLQFEFDTVVTIANPNQITSELRNNDFDVVLLDMNFSAGINTGNEGIFWLGEIKKLSPTCEVVMITAYGDVELAVKAMRDGAADFIQKSWDEEKILSSVINALKIREAKIVISSLKNKQKHLSEKTSANFDLCVGKSPSMLKVFATIEKVAIVRSGQNRRAKLYYLRDRVGRASKLEEKEKFFADVKGAAAAAGTAPSGSLVTTPEK